MNNDLISRSAAIKEFEDILLVCAAKDEDIVEYLRDRIEILAAVDAEVVRHGYWIPQDNTRTKFMCSDCKSRNHDGSGKYCSECGCKMDGDVNANQD